MPRPRSTLLRARAGVPTLALALTAAALAAAPPAGAAPGPARAGHHPSSAHHDHAPLAPTGLRVDDRVDPLAVEGTPQFGWLPHDRDRNERQTAYQVRVSRAGHVVWSSGKVRSSRQSWVRYAGAELTPGTTYSWTVRTWDRHGAASRWARDASFTEGLGDHDWSGAQWIRRPATGNDASNEWTVSRKVLQVSGGSPVVRARAYVAAMGDWAVHANGAEVQRSSSYEYPGEGYYDVADIAGVRAGKPLAIGVLDHYWSCKCQGRANGPNSPEGPSGILVKVVVEHKDGTRDVLVSDGSWQVHRYDPQRVDTLTWRNGDAGDRAEYYDATQEMTGWDTPGYDDSAWDAATVIGVHPRPAAASCAGFEGASAPCTFTHLSAHEAHLRRTTVHPVSVRRLADGAVLADFGTVQSAVPSVHLTDGQAGRQLTFTTSYRWSNTTLAGAVGAGDRTITVANADNIHQGDLVRVDAPADGYGAGDPETRTVVSVEGTTLTLGSPLARAHDAGAWVENSRAGTSKLDTQGSNLRFFYTEKDGAQVAQPFTYWGWRYLEISDPGEELTRDDIAAVVQETDAPRGRAATFSSNKPVLDRVFELMQRSALQSSQNIFLDTPTREKGQFLGDAIDESWATMTASGERNLTREAIVAFMHSQERYWDNGGMNSVYPNGDAKRDIPDYTEMFPEWVWRYYQVTGDRTLLERALPTMQHVADYISGAVDDRGLVVNLPGGSGPYLYGIIDWPAPMRYGYVVDDNAARTVVNALGVSAMRSVARAARALGETGTASTYGDRAGALATAMRQQLRDPGTGLWSDGLAGDGSRIDHFSEHAQTYPIAYGIADTSTVAQLAKYVDSLGMQQGPMTLRVLLEALRVADRPDTIVRLLTDRTSDGPAQVLAEGGTFMWEQWTPGCATSSCTGAEVDQNSSESMSHGWGGAGATGVLESLLGVTVTSPGAATVRIAPADQGLRTASGSVWTERGRVKVGWTRRATGWDTTVRVPVNVTATVALPRAGRSYQVAGKARYLGVRDGRAVYKVGSGATHFMPKR